MQFPLGNLTGRLILPWLWQFARPKLFMGKDSSQGRKGTILAVQQWSRSEGKGESKCVPGPVIQTPVQATSIYSFLRSTVRDPQQQKTPVNIRRISQLEFKAWQLQREGGWGGRACCPKWSSGWVSWRTLHVETS